MATPGVSMNIGVFKDLSKELDTVGASTDLFKGKVVDLIRQLEGLSGIISTLPGGLNSLNQQMQAGGGQFSSQNINQSILQPQQFSPVSKPVTPTQTVTPKPVEMPTYKIVETPDWRDLAKTQHQQQHPNLATSLIDGATGKELPVNRREAVNLTPPLPPIPPSFKTGTDQTSPISVLETSGHLATMANSLGRILIETERNRKLLEQVTTFRPISTPSTQAQGGTTGAGGIPEPPPISKAIPTDEQQRNYDLDRDYYQGLRQKQNVGNWSNRAAIAAGILQNTANLGRTGFNIYQGMEAQDITAQREILAGQGALAQKTYSQFAGQFDLYNARNLMRYGGNILAPGMLQFAGQEGFQRAKQQSFEELAREQQLKETGLKTEMTTGGLSAGAELLGSVAAKKMIAGAIAGSAVGTAIPGFGNAIGAIAGGYMAYDAIKSFEGLSSTYATHPALEMTGGRANTLVGQMANAVFGTNESADIAERTRQKFAVGQANEVMDRARSRQENEINQFPLLEQSLQRVQDLRQMRFAQAGALGNFAGIPIPAVDRDIRFKLDSAFNVSETAYKQSFDRATKVAEDAGVRFNQPPRNTLTDLRRTLDEQTLNRRNVFQEKEKVDINVADQQQIYKEKAIEKEQTIKNDQARLEALLREQSRLPKTGILEGLSPDKIKNIARDFQNINTDKRLLEQQLGEGAFKTIPGEDLVKQEKTQSSLNADIITARTKLKEDQNRALPVPTLFPQNDAARSLQENDADQQQIYKEKAIEKEQTIKNDQARLEALLREQSRLPKTGILEGLSPDKIKNIARDFQNINTDKRLLEQQLGEGAFKTIPGEDLVKQEKTQSSLNADIITARTKLKEDQNRALPVPTLFPQNDAARSLQENDADIQKTRNQIQENLKRRNDIYDLMKKNPMMINEISKPGLDYAVESYVKDPTQLNKFLLKAQPTNLMAAKTGLSDTVSPVAATQAFIESKANELKTSETAKKAAESLAQQNAADQSRAAFTKTQDNVLSRLMEKNEAGNFVNMPFANLGLGTAEVAQRAYAYQNILGVRQMKRTEDVVGRGAENLPPGVQGPERNFGPDQTFMKMNRLSQSGVGSFEQLAGNVTTLQQLRGGTTQQNEQALETILAKGVKAGFEGSRLSQNLVNLVTNISGNLDLRSTGGVTSQLLEGARLAGAGVINERNVRESAAGIQKMAEITGQKEGPMAALRLSGILSSGMRPGHGAEILFNKNSIQARDLEQQINQLAPGKGTLAEKIEQLKKDPDKIQNQELRALVRENDAASLAKGIGNVEGLSQKLMSQIYDLYAEPGQRLEDKIENIKKLGASGKNVDAKKARQELADQLYARAAASNMGDAANTYVSQELVKAGATDKEIKALNARHQEITTEQKEKAGFETAMTEFGQAIHGRKLTTEQYGKILTAGNITTTLGGKEFSGKDIADLEKAAQAGKLTKEQQVQYEELQKQTKNVTTGELAAKQQMKMTDASEPPKQVIISQINQNTMETLADLIAQKMSIKDQLRPPTYEGKH